MQVEMPWSSFPLFDQRQLSLHYSGQIPNTIERHYHTAEHTVLVFKYAKEIYSQYSANFPITFFAHAAAWHDVIYDVTAKDNEEKSARMFLNSLSAGRMDRIQSESIARAIRATANHFAPENEDLPQTAKVFLDADLMELAAPYEVFAHNTEKVIAEYTQKYRPIEVLRGRKEWYEKTLAASRIFWTMPEYDDAVRINLKRAITDIGYAIDRQVYGDY